MALRVNSLGDCLRGNRRPCELSFRVKRRKVAARYTDSVRIDIPRKVTKTITPSLVLGVIDGIFWNLEALCESVPNKPVFKKLSLTSYY